VLETMDPTSDPGDHAPTRSRQLTQPGLVMGTLIYMSPEQSIGDPADHRSDIFSFGTVVYQMLTGEMPFKARNAAAFVHELHYARPRPMMPKGQPLPVEIEELVSGMLANRAKDRPQSMADVARRLRELVHLPGFVQTAVMPAGRRSATASQEVPTTDGGLSKRRRKTAGLGPPKLGSERASIAVLPFESFSASPDDAFMAAGIASEII